MSETIIVHPRSFPTISADVKRDHQEHTDTCSTRCYIVGHLGDQQVMLVPSIRLGGEDKVIVSNEQAKAYEVGGTV